MYFPTRVEIPVAWGEMDALGHVNNAVFFRYFESARIEYFRQLNGDGIDSGPFSPILAQTECNYLRPVHFPDNLVAEARVSRVGSSSLTMEYRLTSTKQDAVVAEGKAVVVNVERQTGKAQPLSPVVKDRIKAHERQTTE
jgi:acyl-CoA thioester hydrolase